MALAKHLRRFVIMVWGDWQTNDLWQRILKDFIACVIATIIAILPELGTRSTFLIPMVVVFAHPGQRMGIMIESLIMILLGALIGLSWSMLGLYLASLVVDENHPAAFSIRAIFLLISTLIHGYLRSSSPRLFIFALFVLIPAVSVLGVPTLANPGIYENIYVPVLIGGAVLVFVNLSIFPELSSSYLGTSTINALNEMVDTLDRASHWFITPGGDYIESRQLDNELSGTTTTKSNTTTTNKQIKQNKAIQAWLKFFSDFPNPFQSARGLAPKSDIPVHLTTLASLTERKSKIRTELATCKNAQVEVNFEIAISPLAPNAMKPISTTHMSSLAQSVITLIGACENKFIVIGDGILDEDIQPRHSDSSQPPAYAEDASESAAPSLILPELNLQPNMGTAFKGKQSKEPTSRVDLVKLNRQIEMSSGRLLESVLRRIREPVQEFRGSMKEAVALLITCLAYCYDVPTLPSGARTPKGIPLAEIDLRIDAFTDALDLFDKESTEQLKQIIMHETGEVLDFMPRMETFLISSFILAFRQSSTHILKMLRHVRQLVEKRQRRSGWPRVWIPQYTNFRKWLSTGGEYDGNTFPENTKQAARRGELAGNSSSTSESGNKDLKDGQHSQGVDDEESCPAAEASNNEPKREKKEKASGKQQGNPDEHPTGWVLRLRGKLADALEWAQDSDDLAYSLKLSVAVFLVSWPAFVPSWNAWYAEVRGTWAPTQLILVFEIAIGSSTFSFFIRLFGVVLGCLSGYVAFLIGGGHRAVVVLVLAFTILPAAYVHIATKYVKVGAVCIVSMTVVALAAVNSSEPALQVFYKRLVAFLVGGVVAMLVEVLIAPVRARDRMVESLSSSVRHIQNMQAAMAVGVDGPEMPDFRSHRLERRFRRSREKAQASIAAAEAFLPFCLTEPRLKGSFKKLEPIYHEIIYVLHQIIDRMDNVVQLRIVYGSSVLEDLNPQVYTYRRSVAASSTLMLFSVNEALTTWLPLPQFIPSARLAQLRLINRVREIITSQMSVVTTPALELSKFHEDYVNEKMARLITKHNFLSWNASVSGQMEIIEYLEELVELVKLLVGVNAFRSGLLERPNYKQYLQQMDSHRASIDRVHTNRVEATMTRRSSTAIQEDASDIQDPVLRRAVTAAVRVEKVKQKLLGPRRESKPAARTVSEGEVDREEVPISLQRVSTRLWRGNEAARRRPRTLSSTSP